MIVKTEAIVLSTMKYRDSSKIVRLYTREFGKISVIAKGARDPKSKFRSALEPMSYVSTVLYKNELRTLHLLSQCDIIRPLRHLSENMEKMYAAMSALELVDIISHDEEENEIMFSLLLSVLEAVNSATKTPVNALYYIETKLSELLGFQANLQYCILCERDVTGMDLNDDTGYVLDRGGIICSDCRSYSPAENTISSATLKILTEFQQATTVSSVMDVEFPIAVNDQIRQSLMQHLRAHVEGFRGLRSEEVFAAIL